jgi:hypothetical protein
MIDLKLLYQHSPGWREEKLEISQRIAAEKPVHEPSSSCLGVMTVTVTVSHDTVFGIQTYRKFHRPRHRSINAREKLF